MDGKNLDSEFCIAFHRSLAEDKMVVFQDDKYTLKDPLEVNLDRSKLQPIYHISQKTDKEREVRELIIRGKRDITTNYICDESYFVVYVDDATIKVNIDKKVAIDIIGSSMFQKYQTQISNEIMQTCDVSSPIEKKIVLWNESKGRSKYKCYYKSTQISAIRWDKKDKCYYGQDYNKKTGHQYATRLENEWVTKHWDKKFLELVQNKANCNYKYVHVPIGNCHEVVPKEDISQNPLVFYTQRGENTCVFSSFASALHFNGYLDEAIEVFEFGRQFVNNQFEYTYKAPQELVYFIQRNKKIFKHFNRVFEVKKIRSSHNLILNKNDFGLKLVVLHGDDNQKNHAVTISGKWIFDSNIDHALVLDQDGLDDCSGKDSKTIGVHYGYHF